MVVKVWNDNTYPYAEKFRGDQINIAPKGYIEMEFYDAHQFLGQMPPNIEVDAAGQQLPKSYKMLRIEQDGQAPVIKKFVCMINGMEFQTQKALDEYIRINHMDSIVDEESKEEFKKDKSIKRSPGRPRKVTNATLGDRDSSS